MQIKLYLTLMHDMKNQKNRIAYELILSKKSEFLSVF